MIFLISPAKTLDFESASLRDDFTEAEFLNQSEKLIKTMRSYKWQGLAKLMSVSEKIAKLNVQRFAEWHRPFTLQNAKQAVFAFKGDVYTGLAVESMTEQQIDYLQSRLRILSGLYGLLRPLDLIQAYRLEMGTKLELPSGKGLYTFWGDKITLAVNGLMGAHKSSLDNDDLVLVNLASNEYFKSINIKKLNVKIITPIFKDEKNGQFKIISFYAKKARGLMVRYAADHLIEKVEALKSFNYDGYTFCDEQSSELEWVFLRNER